jgi:alpha-amylase/alpha-mannosidase (GH57 family)
MAALESIADSCAGEPRVASVILDGENCWEYYDYNGYYFLEELYRRLEAHPAIRTTTFRASLDEGRVAAAPLRRLAAGSWSRGNFSTWIGSPDKNRAWDLLCAAKQSYDLVMASGRLDEARAREAARQLGACEGSDWFWWLEREPTGSDGASFDALFRTHLANLYRFLELPVPATLAQPVHGVPPGARVAKEPA